MEDPDLTQPDPAQVVDVEGEPVANPDDDDAPPPLFLGDPFALANAAELVEANPDAGVPGSFATVKCECGQLFRFNLLRDGAKKCPGCGTGFTHVLVVCPTDDDATAGTLFQEILVVNGIGPDGDELDDDDDQGDDDTPTVPEAK